MRDVEGQGFLIPTSVWCLGGRYVLYYLLASQTQRQMSEEKIETNMNSLRRKLLTERERMREKENGTPVSRNRV